MLDFRVRYKIYSQQGIWEKADTASVFKEVYFRQLNWSLSTPTHPNMIKKKVAHVSHEVGKIKPGVACEEV